MISEDVQEDELSSLELRTLEGHYAGPVLPNEVQDLSARCDEELVAAIMGLWKSHVKADDRYSKSLVERNLERSKLAACLSEWKARLVRRGSKGEWAAFLRARKFSRTTADRLVRQHRAKLKGAPPKRTPGAFLQLSDIPNLVKSYTRRLLPRLATYETVEAFVLALRLSLVRGLAAETNEQLASADEESLVSHMYSESTLPADELMQSELTLQRTAI